MLIQWKATFDYSGTEPVGGAMFHIPAGGAAEVSDAKGKQMIEDYPQWAVEVKPAKKGKD